MAEYIRRLVDDDLIGIEPQPSPNSWSTPSAPASRASRTRSSSPTSRPPQPREPRSQPRTSPSSIAPAGPRRSGSAYTRPSPSTGTTRSVDSVGAEHRPSPSTRDQHPEPEHRRPATSALRAAPGSSRPNEGAGDRMLIAGRPVGDAGADPLRRETTGMLGGGRACRAPTDRAGSRPGLSRALETVEAGEK